MTAEPIPMDQRLHMLPELPEITTIGHEFLSPEQVCERVPGWTVRKLADLRGKAGEGPVFTPLDSKTCVYDWPDVVAWLVEQKRTVTDRFGVKNPQ